MNKSLLTAVLVATALSATAAPVTFKKAVRLDAPRPTLVSDDADNIIYDQPEGKLTWLDRSCDGFVTESFEAYHSDILGSIVQMVEADDGTVYLSHIASEYPVNTWIKAQRSGSTLTIEGAQPVYTEYDWDYDEDLVIYVVPMELQVGDNSDGTFVATDDLKYTFNIGADGSLTAADPDLLLGICVRSLDETATGKDVWIWRGFGDRKISMKPVTATPVDLPDGAKPEKWVWSDKYESAFVNVAVNGNDIYVSGMDRSLPEAWIKGTVSGDKVEFASGQYLGPDMEIFYYSYFSGAEFTYEEVTQGDPVMKASLTDKAVFSYDAANRKLTADEGYVINSTASELFPLYGYTDVTVAFQKRNSKAVPATAYDLEFIEDPYSGNSIWFMLPNTDVDGNLLVESYLYYEVTVDGKVQEFTTTDADWNEVQISKIPYAFDDQYIFWVDGLDHTVYLDTEVEHYIGVTSIYVNELGEELRSAMTVWGENGINGIATERSVVAEQWYDLQGRPVSRDIHGPAIKVTTYSDGSVTTAKRIVR